MKEKNELQSRREFFKNAAKRALPILGAVVLAGTPNIMMAVENRPSTCVGNCEGTCKFTCYNTCSGSCKGTCEGKCYNTCKGSCSRGCKGSCTGQVKY